MSLTVWIFYVLLGSLLFAGKCRGSLIPRRFSGPRVSRLKASWSTPTLGKQTETDESAQRGLWLCNFIRVCSY